MASPAICSKGLIMLLHIGRVDLCMADITCQRIETRKTATVTVLAGKIRAISLPLMSGKRKTHVEMWEFRQVQDGQGAIWTVMVGMAAITWDQAALRQHDFVKIFGVGVQLGVACQAAIGHALF